MARFFDVGQEATGIIAVGQYATGVIAIGQVATGVIAIGQLARGVIAIGMASLGLVSIGMAAAGVFYCGGIVGVGGTKWFGFVLPLVPRGGKRHRLPPTVPLANLTSGALDEGWVRLSLAVGPDGVPWFFDRKQRIEIKLQSGLQQAVHASFSNRPKPILAHLRKPAADLVCARIMAPPVSRLRSAKWWVLGTLQILGLVATVFAFWFFAGYPVGKALFESGGLLR